MKMYTGKVDIYYDNKIEKKLSSEKAIAIAFGRLALPIRERLSEFSVANNLEEISTNPPPRRHKLEGGNRWSVCVSKNFRIVFTGNDTDPKNVTSITIIDIIDYH